MSKENNKKNYYDLYTILSTRNYDNDILQEAIIRTFKNRRTSYDADTMFSVKTLRITISCKSDGWHSYAK